MQHAFVFRHVAVVVRHWFEIGMSDGIMEHGARLELRLLEPSPHRGTESAPQLVVIDRPLWRADLFDRLDRPAGTFSAAHFHGRFDGIEPSHRMWDPDLTRDPWTWAERQLSNVDALCDASGIGAEAAHDDVDEVRLEAEAIVQTAKTLSPMACTSVDNCHRWTRDATHAVQLMVDNMEHVELLDRSYAAPWLDVPATA
jgi:hypothetical protein